jgi:hypothetical protein
MENQEERNSKNCQCCTCIYGRVFYLYAVRGIKGKKKMILCCQDKVKLDHTGEKPKILCHNYKKRDKGQVSLDFAKDYYKREEDIVNNRL